MSVAFGLLFIGVRVFYTLVALVTQAEELDMVNGAIAIRVVLGFLMELIAALAYVVAGFMTQGKGLLIRRKPEPEVPRSEVREPVEYA